MHSSRIPTGRGGVSPYSEDASDARTSSSAPRRTAGRALSQASSGSANTLPLRSRGPSTTDIGADTASTSASSADRRRRVGPAERVASAASAASAMPVPAMPRAPSVTLAADGQTIHVPDGATLTDVLPFLVRMNQTGSARLIARREGDGHAMQWVRSARAEPAQQEQAREVMRRLVRNIAPNVAPGSPMDVVLSAAVEEIDQHATLDRPTIANLRALISEHVHRVAMMNLPASSVDIQEAPRPTTSVMAHWLDAIDEALSHTPRSDRARRDVLFGFQRMARDCWDAHQLRPAELVAFLVAARASAHSAGLSDLSSIAGSLRREVELGALRKDKALAAGPIDGSTAMRAAEFDNPMGRAYDSALANYLYTRPPESMLRAADAFAEGLQRRMSALARSDPAAYRAVARDVRHEMRGDSRPWMDRLQRYRDFVDGSRDDAPEHFMTYLRGQVRNSDGCTAIYLTHVALSNAMKRHAPVFLDWDNTDQDNRDYEALHVARDRVRDSRIVARGTGVLLPHHPVLDGDPHPGTVGHRSAAASHPGMVDPTPENAMGLETGLVYGSGPSGVAGLIAKGIAALREDRAAPVVIDGRDAMLGAFVALCHDGGHSLNEIMWALNQLKPRIDMGIGDEAQPPQSYRADYRTFFRAFPSESPTRERLEKARDHAHDAMIDYRRDIIAKPELLRSRSTSPSSVGSARRGER